jgi:hypothetical protein
MSKEKLDILLEEVEGSYEWEDLINQLEPYAKETLGYENSPEIELRDDPDNAEKMHKALTGQYDPNTSTVIIYTTDRHPKDILRSLCHELVHHHQHETGELDDVSDIPAEDFRENPKLKELEDKAYSLGGCILKGFSYDE